MVIVQFSTVFSNFSVHRNPPEGLFKDELLGSILILILTLILVGGWGKNFHFQQVARLFVAAGPRMTLGVPQV